MHNMRETAESETSIYLLEFVNLSSKKIKAVKTGNSKNKKLNNIVSIKPNFLPDLHQFTFFIEIVHYGTTLVYIIQSL